MDENHQKLLNLIKSGDERQFELAAKILEGNKLPLSALWPYIKELFLLFEGDEEKVKYFYYKFFKNSRSVLIERIFDLMIQELKIKDEIYKLFEIAAPLNKAQRKNPLKPRVDIFNNQKIK